jgi:DNA repair exonuclease SbcCD ATPase subunit
MIDVLYVIISALFAACLFLFITKRKTNKEAVSLREDIDKYEKEIAAKQLEVDRLTSDRDRLIKYEAIIDVGAAVTEMRSNADKHVADANNRATELLKSASDTVEQKTAELQELQQRYKDGLETYTRLKEEVSLYEGKVDVIEYGMYDPVYSFEFSAQYQVELYGVREKQKEMIRQRKAVVCGMEWKTFESGVKNMIQEQKKLMLRIFNGECDYLISKVKWNNIGQIRDRLLMQYESINKTGEDNNIMITFEYRKLKLDELFLEYEYQEKRQEEKEAQRLAREQIREEEKAHEEYELAQRKAEEEARIYQKALTKAREEITQSTGKTQVELQLKIQQLEAELQEVIQKAQKAKSMAEQTKSGHVYVISNIGSFGENVYKIGMTRRLEPMDRVKELGDASVPFKFDVHALMFSDDAPKLESELHRLFNAKKVNMVNNRKEFYNVSIDDIEIATKNIGMNVEFMKIPEAKEYRETLAIMEKNKNPTQPSTIREQIRAEFPETI